MSAALETRAERFWDDRLTPAQNKVVEMLRNGFSRGEIAEELDVLASCVSSHAHYARKRAPDIYIPRPPHPQIRGCVSLARLLELRAFYRRAGVETGIHHRIAERVGMTENAVNVRLWRFDHGKGPKP